MRKCVATICGMALVLSLMACGGKSPEPTAAPTTSETTAAETTAAPETAASETAAPETTVAETTAPAADLTPIHVYASIASAGELVVAGEAIEVTDQDGDGAFTVNDVMMAAHVQFYSGADGFASADLGYGLSIVKLWGVENGGSYGIYINDEFAMSALDPVKEGDKVYAYSFKDLAAWSDMYTFFRAEDGEYSLIGVSFDANGNPTNVPVAGAHILLDGVDSGIVTDEEGHFTPENQAKVMTATSEAQTLVPPILVFE